MPDWKQLCRGAQGITIEGGGVTVVMADERRHRIAIRETAGTIELTAIVARRDVTDTISDLPLRTWRRNRSAQLVGFRLDHKDRLVGEAWVPKAGLSREEFLHYIQRIAAECDRFEYQLTGKDRE